ncbi:MAG: photosystem I reaction center subunit IX [Xanthomonadales bacterium]|nr:photosystem I reaction center subunit IX [Xanthomonadales bacterium]
MSLRYLKKIPTCSVVILLITLSQMAIGADSGYEVLYQATPTDRLYSIDFCGSSGIAVGEAGLLMRSSDSGLTWHRDEIPTNLALSKIACTESRELVVGQLGAILVKRGASEWRQIDSGTRLRLLGVDMNSGGLGVIVGAFGTLLRTTTGGETWESIAPDWAALYDDGTRGQYAAVRDEPTNYIVKVFENDRIVIGGEYGVLLESLDRGHTWTVVFRYPEIGGITAPTIFDAQFDGQRGYAVGQNGLVLASEDAGKTWLSVAAPTKASLFAVGLLDGSRLFAVGQRVAIASDNGGLSWTNIHGLDFDLNWYAGAGKAMGASGPLIAIGHSGRIVSVAAFE